MHLLFLLIHKLLVPLFFLSLFSSLWKFLRDGSVLRDFMANMNTRRDWQNGPNGGNGSSAGGSGGQGSGNAYTGAAGTASPYQILGLPRTATNDEIRARYRELIAKYHPDKFAGLDDPEFSRLAAKKFQQVQGAYEELKRRRGF